MQCRTVFPVFVLLRYHDVFKARAHWATQPLAWRSGFSCVAGCASRTALELLPEGKTRINLRSNSTMCQETLPGKHKSNCPRRVPSRNRHDLSLPFWWAQAVELTFSPAILKIWHTSGRVGRTTRFCFGINSTADMPSFSWLITNVFPLGCVCLGCNTGE